MENDTLFHQHGNSKQTSPSLLIQEVADDETGYDADVEVLRPDEYEELDSEKSDEAASSTESDERWRHDLIKHMKSLTCNPDAQGVCKENNSSRGRKRRSKDAFGISAAPSSVPHSDAQIEVIELVNSQDSRPQPKRVRHGSRRSKATNQLSPEPLGTESEPREALRDTREVENAGQESITMESSSQMHEDDDMDLD